jgi:hypothetical protein
VKAPGRASVVHRGRTGNLNDVLRCSNCGELASDWAGRCPRCGADLSTALAEEVPAGSSRRVVRRRRSTVIVDVALAIVAAVTAGRVVSGGRSVPRAATAAPTTSSGVLTFADIRTSAAGLEDERFQAGRITGYVVGDKKPAVVSTAMGNGVMAWEPMPGIVALVGYSGRRLDDNAFSALDRLASRLRFADETIWYATHPQINP